MATPKSRLNKPADPAKPLSGIKEVAALAGVSVGTVSNVLNRPDKVSEATRKRIEIVIEHLGFTPNRGAAALRSGRSRIIGLLVPDMTNPFFAETARGAIDAADDHGYVVTLCNSDGEEARERRYLEVLQEQPVAGILITPAESRPKDLERLRTQTDSQVVVLDVAADPADYCSASVDDVLGGTLAAQHLIDAGARNLVLVNGPRTLRQCADRRRGVRAAVRRAGNVTLTELELAAMTTSAGAKAVTRIRDLETAPDAIFCTNDLLAIGVQRGLTAHGVRVPADVLLMGYDDIEQAAESDIPLTSVRQPTHLLGRTATDMLIRELEEGPEHRHARQVFRPELVARESTGWR